MTSFCCCMTCFLAIVIWRVSYSIEIWIHPHTKHIHFVVISLETIFLIVAEQNDGQLSVFGYQTSQSDAENDDRQANRQKITVGILFLKMVTSWKKASNLGVCVCCTVHTARFDGSFHFKNQIHIHDWRSHFWIAECWYNHDSWLLTQSERLKSDLLERRRIRIFVVVFFSVKN